MVNQSVVVPGRFVQSNSVARRFLMVSAMYSARAWMVDVGCTPPEVTQMAFDDEQVVIALGGGAGHSMARGVEGVVNARVDISGARPESQLLLDRVQDRTHDVGRQ